MVSKGSPKKQNEKEEGRVNFAESNTNDMDSSHATTQMHKTCLTSLPILCRATPAPTLRVPFSKRKKKPSDRHSETRLASLSLSHTQTHTHTHTQKERDLQKLRYIRSERLP